MPTHSLSQDTIVAVSTPAGRSSRAIIRLSGPDALTYVDSIFSTDYYTNQRQSSFDPLQGKSALGNVTAYAIAGEPQNILRSSQTYSAIRGSISLPVQSLPLVGCQSKAEGFHSYPGKEKLTVPACIYIMKAPYSYTREDVVEIHTFGATPLLEMIIDTLVGFGARIADPGEFTKRAFLHGRIDLTQAEAVIRVIKSRTDTELRTASAQLAGALSQAARKVHNQLLDLCTHVEVSIDFSDQDIELISDGEIQKRIKELLNAVQNLLSHSPPSKIATEGVLTVITGKPNVGKSSLMNALAKEKMAIVTSIPGTTRDALETTLTIDGMTFRLIDTAGLDMLVSWYESPDQASQFSQRVRRTQTDQTHPDMGKDERVESTDVRQLAAQKSRDMLETAELVIFVIDISEGITKSEVELFKSINQRKIIVLNKTDLQHHVDADDIERLYDSNIRSTNPPVIRTSAITGEGLEQLKNEMVKAITSGDIDRSVSSFILNSRHKEALRSVETALRRALQTSELGESWEFVALDLRQALNSLGEIVGEVVTEDILDRIFSEFCIGK